MNYKEVCERFGFLIGRVVVYRVNGQFCGEYVIGSFESNYDTEDEEHEEVGLCDESGNSLLDITISDLEEFANRGIFAYTTSSGSVEEFILRSGSYNYRDQFLSLVGYSLEHELSGLRSVDQVYVEVPKEITSVSFNEDDDGVLRGVVLQHHGDTLLELSREDFGAFLNEHVFVGFDSGGRRNSWSLLLQLC